MVIYGCTADFHPASVMAFAASSRRPALSDTEPQELKSQAPSVRRWYAHWGSRPSMNWMTILSKKLTALFAQVAHHVAVGRPSPHRRILRGFGAYAGAASPRRR